MIRKLLFGSLTLCLLSQASYAQYEVFQFFDGSDTTDWNSFSFDIDSTSLWQIGQPQKSFIDSAFSYPNALITDTVLPYTSGMADTVGFLASTDVFGTWGVLMLRWTQKLHMRDSLDIGRVEFMAEGFEWESAFDNPYVYAFYGFDEANVTYGPEKGFTGVDSTWKDIWLCYDMSYMQWSDSLRVRYIFQSDTMELDPNVAYDGWALDNFMQGITMFHTLAEEDLDVYMKAYPTLTDGRVYIETQKQEQRHRIEQIEVFDLYGNLIERIGSRPVKTFVDLGHLRDGTYLMKVSTNLRVSEFKIVLQH